jgi:osmotically-inducible protein OsmY
MRKPNKILESEVLDLLDWDLLLGSSRIDAKAEDGVVTLTGVVYTYDEFLLAEDDARNVSGVKEVHNELLVGPLGEAVADTYIAAACTAALEATRAVPKGSVSVQVNHGWVTLSGQVRDHFQRLAAKLAVGPVGGVRGITDEVVISTDPIPGDVADRVNKALKRSALLEDASVAASNVGSTIYLDGTVGSYAAKRKAEDAAWNAPGVTNVVDRTTIIV